MKKRPDGRYCKQVHVGYNPNGTRKMKTIYGKTVREVEKKEREFKTQIDAGLKMIDDLTLGEWADLWLKTYKINVEYNTFRRYEVVINNQIKPIFGRYKLSDINLNMIQNAINDLSKTYSQSTLKKFKITLNQLFKTAVITGRITINPLQGVVLPKPDFRIGDDMKFIPEEIVSELRCFCKNYKNGDFIMTLLYTGIRRGEITALTWEDINDDCIYINKAAEFVNNQPRIKAPKSRSGIRVVPFLEILKGYLVRPINAKDTDCVFKNASGKMHTQQSLKRMMEIFNKDFSEYLREKGLNSPKITMHQFRHTYATILYKAGIDIKTAQMYLGHSSISVTLDIYTHLDKKHKCINADKLNSFICA